MNKLTLFFVLYLLSQNHIDNFHVRNEIQAVSEPTRVSANKTKEEMIVQKGRF